MVAGILSSLITAYMLILIARAVISWLPMFNVRVDPYNPIVRAIHQLTEPAL
ncbi:MAG: YggT family protein, partial [Chloroflexota bacterium]